MVLSATNAHISNQKPANARNPIPSTSMSKPTKYAVKAVTTESQTRKPRHLDSTLIKSQPPDLSKFTIYPNTQQFSLYVSSECSELPADPCEMLEQKARESGLSEWFISVKHNIWSHEIEQPFSVYNLYGNKRDNR